jgi:predicted dehydrogenase
LNGGEAIWWLPGDGGEPNKVGMQSCGPSTRRSFLKQLGLGVGCAPWMTSGLLGTSPNGRIRHASFGAGGMAWADLGAIARHPSVDLVAVADVDLTRTVQVRERFGGVRVYQDWRELLDRERDLDSVNVSTPDHIHAPMVMASLQRGLHVFGQKPLTHGIYEARRVTEVAREKRRVTQMGIQIHSNAEYRLAVRLVRDGVIGPVEEVHTWSSKKWGDTAPMPRRTDPVPDGLDWDGWVGVCAARPFIGGGWYHPSNWRRRLDFGTGTFGDMGCHIYDPVYKALALTAPVSVRSEGQAPNDHSWATDAVIDYVFPQTPYTAGETVRVTWYDGDRRPPAEVQERVGVLPPGPDGTVREGSRRLPYEGSILVGRKGTMLIPHVGWPQLFPEADFRDLELPSVGSADHWRQYVEAMLGQGETSTGFDYSGPLTEAVLLGSVASRFPGATLDWDAAKLRFTNVAEANVYVRRRYRAGWEVDGL